MLEASVIVAELQQLGAAEVERVRQQAHAGGADCPLWKETGQCACSLVRPLACLGKCSAGYDVDAAWARGLGETFSGALRNSLRREHRDDKLHDLNEALGSLLSATASRPGSPRSRT